MARQTTDLAEAKELESKGRYQEAEDLLSRIIELDPQSRGRDLATAFNQRGVVRRMLRKYEDALSDYQAALACSRNHNQTALAYVNIADIERVAHSDFGAAHASLDEALTFAGNGTFAHASAANQRGLVFVGQEDFQSAIIYYEKAMDICERLMEHAPGDKETEKRFAQAANNGCYAYLRANDPDRIDNAYRAQARAMDIFTRIGDLQGVVNTVTNIGRIAQIKNDYDEAIRQYEKAWEILKETKYDRAVTALALDLAEAHLSKKDNNKAKIYLERFRDGILNKEITEHDIKIMKPQFDKTASMYDSAGMDIERFDDVRKLLA